MQLPAPDPREHALARTMGLPDLMAHFTTPPGLELEAAAAAYGHGFARVADLPSLTGAIAEAREPAGATLIQAIVPPEDAAARNRDLHARVAALLSESMG